MNRLGIFGGTFNPIHKGHINMVLHFREALCLDKVLIIPTNIPPHKEAPGLADPCDRVSMCRLACDEYDFLQVSDIEAKRKGCSYTVETLREIGEQYPCTRMYLLMGSDMFLSFEQWHRYCEIMKRAVICTAPRECHQLDAMHEQRKRLAAQGGSVIILERLEVIELSSTEVRESLKCSGTTKGLLSPLVEQYILENRIYTN